MSESLVALFQENQFLIDCRTEHGSCVHLAPRSKNNLFTWLLELQLCFTCHIVYVLHRRIVFLCSFFLILVEYYVLGLTVHPNFPCSNGKFPKYWRIQLPIYRYAWLSWTWQIRVLRASGALRGTCQPYIKNTKEFKLFRHILIYWLPWMVNACAP